MQNCMEESSVRPDLWPVESWKYSVANQRPSCILEVEEESVESFM